MVAGKGCIAVVIHVVGVITRGIESRNGFHFISHNFHLVVDHNAPGSSTKPRLSIGAEYQLLSFLPLRSGYSVGGGRTSAFSFGSGVRFLGFYLDAAVLTGTSGTIYSAKGANIAISTGFQF